MSLRDAEFRALRATIAWRGTVRMGLVPVVLIGWAAAWCALWLTGERGLAAAIPLLVLAGGYEAVHALHVGVERIGRYLQVSYEDGLEGPLWESTAMRLGPGLPGGGVDPLFTLVFVLACGANLLLVVPRTRGMVPAAIVGLALHAAFVARLVRARRAASRQRTMDLERMRVVRTELHRSDPASGPGMPRPT
jgi:hypothetical protein